MIVTKQKLDGTMGLEGTQKDDAGGGFITVKAEWNASSVDKVFFVAARPMKVVSINPRVTVAGTDAGAVTAVVRKVPPGIAIASGTALHSGTINLQGAANTNRAVTLSTTAGVLDIAAGNALGINFTGVLTSATGVVTVTMVPA